MVDHKVVNKLDDDGGNCAMNLMTNQDGTQWSQDQQGKVQHFYLSWDQDCVCHEVVSMLEDNEERLLDFVLLCRQIKKKLSLLDFVLLCREIKKKHCSLTIKFPWIP